MSGGWSTTNLWLSRLLGKAGEKGLADFSDAELQRVFGGCVAPNRCIDTFKKLVGSGDITAADLKGE